MKITVLARNTVVSHQPTTCSRADGVMTSGVWRLMKTPAVTTARTPLTWSAWAGTYATNGTSTEITVCVGVSRNWRQAATARSATTSPLAHAPSAAVTNASDALANENVPETTAATAMT